MARVDRPASETLESMLGHPAIQRRSADSQSRGGRRNVTVMSSEGTFDSAALQRIQLKSLGLTPRTCDLRGSGHRCNELVVAPRLEHEVRRAPLQCFDGERYAAVRRHQHDGKRGI